MAMSVEERRLKQREYNRQYYLAHRARKLEQNARSARRWREKYPERYRLSQERCRERARELRGTTPRKPRVRECSVCGEMRPHKARDMCAGCYGRWRWETAKLESRAKPAIIQSPAVITVRTHTAEPMPAAVGAMAEAT